MNWLCLRMCSDYEVIEPAPSGVNEERNTYESAIYISRVVGSVDFGGDAAAHAK